jgi:hypothetical protein
MQCTRNQSNFLTYTYIVWCYRSKVTNKNSKGPTPLLSTLNGKSIDSTWSLIDLSLPSIGSTIIMVTWIGRVKV